MNVIPSENNKTLDIINKLEAHMDELPETMHGDCFPLEHSFAKGLYVRQISVPKGYLIISKIHKYSHAAFLLKGEISIIGTDGIRRIKAPMSIITPPGTKRAIYHHEDTVFATVHATQETDLGKIEDEIIAKNFKEIDDCIDVEFTSNIRTFLEKGE